jgi:hypothetical protein
MSKVLVLSVFAAALTVAGCNSRGGSALLGGGVGAAAGAGGYEYHLNQQKQRVQQDQKDGKISADEARIRLDQISRDSFVQ